MPDRKVVLILASFVFLTIVSSFTVAAPFLGLSTMLGVSVLGSSVLGSSVLGSSVMSSSVMTSTIVEAYGQAVVFMQPILCIMLIGLLVYLDLTDSSNGDLKSMLLELRKSWLPISGLLTILFSIIVALRVWNLWA